MELFVVGLTISGFLLASGSAMDNADIISFHFMENVGQLGRSLKNQRLNSSRRELEDGFADETSFYPGVADNYVYPASSIDLETPEMVPDQENFGSFHIASEGGRQSRPEFWTRGQHRPSKAAAIGWPEPPTMSGSHYYVQKIDPPKRRFSSTTPPHGLDAANSNRYEEVELTISPVTEPSTNSPMNGLMKKFLAKLLVEQYGRRPIKGKVERTNKTGSQSSQNPKTSKQEQELKFLYGDTLGTLKNKTLAKLKQFFGIFTVVKFNNSECNTTNWAGTWQGTCLTASECTRMSGTALGGCARGFGVCCVFRGTCGDSASTNCTYFQSPNYPDYYPANGGVVTPTTTPVPALSPTPDPRTLAKGRQSSSDSSSCVFTISKANANVQQLRIDFVDLDLAGPTNGTCTDERLVISGQNANDQIPVICGYNTGQHVYVDVSQLSGPVAIMNNLNYAVCIRREAGYCSITYSSQNYPFQLVNSLPNGQITVPAGQAGVDVLNCPDDFIIIDGTRLCGDRFNDGSTVMNFSQNAPVVDTSSGPIVINVRSNSNVTGLGFKLRFTQNRCPAN
ncbi:hypothetical protein YQE_08384, partial [Dendroctonus ponderosae]